MPPDSPPRSPAVLVAPATPDQHHHHHPSSSPPTSSSTRTSTASSSLRPISVTLPPSSNRSRSRSPSPSPSLSRSSTPTDSSSSSATAALVHAGLGLVGSLPPSPVIPRSPALPHDERRDAGDEVEHLAEPDDDGERGPASSSSLALPGQGDAAHDGRKRAPSIVGFVEPDLPQREGRGGAESRGRRERKRSFIGLGFGSSGDGDEGSPAGARGGGFARRISFGAFSSSGGGGGGGGAVEDSNDPQRTSPHPSSAAAPIPAPVPPQPQSRKASGPKALLRRAKSFGTTSPVLGSSPGGNGAFPSSSASPPLAPPSSSHTASAASPNAPLSLPRLSTSSLDPSSASCALSSCYSPSPSGHSTPLTPSSPYYFPTSAASAQASTSTMVLPEPAPVQPHWLFMGSPTASTSTLPPSSSSAEGAGLLAPERGGPQGRRRSADEERARGSTDEAGANGRGREKDQQQQQQQGKTPKKRRATLGGLFGRKDKSSSSAAAAAAEREGSWEAARNSADTAGSGSLGGGLLYDSPSASPGLVTSTNGSVGMPSLPSLPSLQLSSNPYRMSWAFGATNSSPNTSPHTSPAKKASGGSNSPARRMSTASIPSPHAASPLPSRSGSPTSLSTSTRPALSITTTPPNVSPSPNSPTKPSPLSSSPLVGSTSPQPDSSASTAFPPSPSSRPPLLSHQTLPVPLSSTAPPLHQTNSYDSSSTLLASASATTPTAASLNGRHTLSRAHSASSPPLLRRSNSYVPPPTSSANGGSYVPLTRSPLSSPTTERGNPLLSATLPPSGSPSLAKTLIRTRPARSHSDASDRRPPSSLPNPTPPASPPKPTSPGAFYGGGRNMVMGGMGYPAAGGYFAQAHQKVGAGRNSGDGRSSTSGESGSAGGGGGGGRTSVFGSLGSFFHGGSSGGGGGGGTGGATSQGMSRSSSAATATTASGMGTPTLENGPATTSEFGALFGGGGDGGGGGGGKRSASVSRPGTGRKRGLSVGAGGFGSLFGGGKSETASASQGSLPPLAAVQGRDRSGSASSARTSSSSGGAGGLLSPPAEHGASVVGGRVRALTDPPNRRFSFMGGGGGSFSPSASSAALLPPGAGSRPSTADGATSPARGPAAGGRARGSSLSMVVGGGGGGGSTSPSPGPSRPAPPKERKVPKPRVEEGETPEEWVRRLMEGERGRVVRRRKEKRDEEEEGEKGEGVKEEEEFEEVEEEGTEPLPKGEITRALAQSSDPFHASALAAYLRLFPFHHLALDIALRVFLSAASLPSETQQIDRVMEAFARRWCKCNPGVFAGKKPPAPAQTETEEKALEERERKKKEKEGEESDIPYVLAFSMVMLNTDHFNPNAKSKMTKADYVKNTRIDGLASEILEYLYDQITLAPFIFVDSNSTDDSASSLFTPSASSTSLLGGSIGPGGHQPSPYASSSNSSGFFGGGGGKGKGIDPYHLIATGQTSRFRVDVESHIPAKSPFSFTGTTAFFNATTLHALFARAPILQITTRSRSSSKSSPSPHVTPVGPPPPLPGASPNDSTTSPSAASALEGSPLMPVASNGTFIADPPKKKDRPTISSLKITKIGLLSRKEDLAEGGKKAASRKWKGWSVVLTGSQLLFFKDPHFAASLQHALDAAASASEPKPDDNHVLVFSIQTPFKPDAVLSLAQSAAIYDSTYSKYSNVFRLVAPAGRQYLFQAHNADDLNSWLHAINYAASFKTAGIRIRPLQPVIPSTPSSVATGSPRTSPAPASPHFPTPLERNGNGLPQPMVQLQDPATLGSLASTVDMVSPKGSLAPSGDDETIQPSAIGKTGGTGDDSLPKSLQAALTASEAANSNGHAASMSASASASPRPSETSFVQLASVTARADLLRTKISELDAEISRVREGLRVDLRLAKHLAVLTPFKSSTRERVLTAIPPIEKRVRYARMSVAKLVCYREVLSRDLLVEDRETERLVRKQSHHRTHSRRTSSIPRNRSPAPQRPSSPRHSSSFHPHPLGTSSLSRSASSLHPPRSSHAFQSDTEHTPRGSFESTADSLNGAFDAPHFGQPLSLTDDELDRLQVRSPPLMQRSKTEDWQLNHRDLPPPVGVNGSNGAALHGLALHEAHLHPQHAHDLLHPSEDELEVPPQLDANGGAATPIKKRSTDPAELAIRGVRPSPREREESREVLLAAPPPLEQRHSN
ncbi:hypothetical protein JCM6882_003959 [Rhodosporidiobolus microsporus]